MRRLVPRRHQPQDEQEHVDEIEVQDECAEDGHLAVHLRSALDRVADLLDLLRVVRGEADEDGQADVGDGPVQGVAREEQVRGRGSPEPAGIDCDFSSTTGSERFSCSISEITGTSSDGLLGINDSRPLPNGSISLSLKRKMQKAKCKIYVSRLCRDGFKFSQSTKSRNYLLLGLLLRLV